MENRTNLSRFRELGIAKLWHQSLEKSEERRQKVDCLHLKFVRGLCGNSAGSEVVGY